MPRETVGDTRHPVSERADDGPQTRKSGAGGGIHWFGNKDLPVLLYRVNRRPPAGGQLTLFKQPRDVFAHFRLVLRYRPVAETGRGTKHVWRIGNRRVFNRDRVLVGRIGWTRSDEVQSTVFNEKVSSWIDTTETRNVTAVAPFVFDASSRFLGVLKHPTFTEPQIAAVFTRMLNEGESHRTMPTTDWAVEPIGDEQDFLAWIAETDAIDSVDFVFRRPNPDGSAEFEELFGRMSEMKAREIREEIKAADETGLSKQALVSDGTSVAFRAAAAVGFGYLLARGHRTNRRVSYDQRSNVARETVVAAPDNWSGVTREVRLAVLRGIERLGRPRP